MPMLGACVQGSAPRGQISVNDGKIKRGSERHASTSPQDNPHTHTHTRAQCQPRGPRKQPVAVPRWAAPCRADAGDVGSDSGPWPIFGSRAGGLGGAGATPDFDGNCWVTRHGTHPPRSELRVRVAGPLERGRSGCRSIILILILIRSLLPAADQVRRPALRQSARGPRRNRARDSGQRHNVHAHVVPDCSICRCQHVTSRGP